MNVKGLLQNKTKQKKNLQNGQKKNLGRASFGGYVGAQQTNNYSWSAESESTCNRGCQIILSYMYIAFYNCDINAHVSSASVSNVGTSFVTFRSCNTEFL